MNEADMSGASSTTADAVSKYRYDPDLAPYVSMLPVPGPASPTSGVAEAHESRAAAAAFLQTGSSPPLPPNVVVEDVVIPGGASAPDVPVRVYRPEAAAATAAAVLSIHGGGFSIGSIYPGNAGAADLVRDLGVVVVDVEYRLAPEHPAPAAIEDCYAALVWLHDEADDLGVDPDRIMIMGGSAGGGIAAGLALYARDQGGPNACFQLLMIPELDDRLDTPSMRRFDDTPLWTRHAAEQSWRWYLGGATGDDISPYASPARAKNLSGLPPAYISVMEFDPLRDEGIHYALRLLEAGVNVELHLFPGTFHGSGMFPEAAVSQRETKERRAVIERALGIG